MTVAGKLSNLDNGSFKYEANKISSKQAVFLNKCLSEVLNAESYLACIRSTSEVDIFR